MALLFLFLLLFSPFNFYPSLPPLRLKNPLPVMVFWISGFCEYSPNPSASLRKLDQLLQSLYAQVSSREGFGGSEQVGGWLGLDHIQTIPPPLRGLQYLGRNFFSFFFLEEVL